MKSVYNGILSLDSVTAKVISSFGDCICMKLLYYLLGLTNTFVFHEERLQLIWSVRDFGDSIDNLDFVKVFARTNGLVEGSYKKPELTFKGEQVISHLYHKLFYVEEPRSWMMGKVLRINKQQEIDYNNQKVHFRNYVISRFSIAFYIVPTVLATILATLISIRIIPIILGVN